MVKTNSKKSVIALVVMAILLVLSMAMTITGAWFTDKLTPDDVTLNFGIVDIEFGENADAYSVKVDGLDGTHIMPGCTLNLGGKIVNKGDSAYIAYRLTLQFATGFSLTDEEEAALPATWAWDDTALTLSYTVDATAETAKDGTVNLPGDLPIPNSIGNSAAQTSVTVDLEVRAIQSEHNTTIKTFDQMASVVAQTKSYVPAV